MILNKMCTPTKILLILSLLNIIITYIFDASILHKNAKLLAIIISNLGWLVTMFITNLLCSYNYNNIAWVISIFYLVSLIIGLLMLLYVLLVWKVKNPDKWNKVKQYMIA